MSAGFLVLALLAFGGGVFMQRAQPPRPPTVPRGPGLGGWRVAEGIYLPMDLGVVGFLVVFYGIFPLAATLVPATGQPVEIGVLVLAVNAAVQFFLMAMVIGVVAWRQHPVQWLGLRWRPVPVVLTVLIVIGAGMLATVATGFFAAGLELVGYQDWLLAQLGHQELEDAAQDVVKAFKEAGDDPAVLTMLCLTAVVVAPITEEVIFRGYLYPVAKRFAGRWAAVAFSSLLFAMVHQNSIALLPLAFLAVLLALSYEWSGSIWAPIGIHMFFNGTTVFLEVGQLLEWFTLPET
ncbi:lysostaphin resistance A-like protein [Haloferula sp. A504]|jgi:membrane protease YdiL (CAAX protease family)|uniref:lysostaphin resistance A-like protein n=1 Tax=Haloferula sp. A504 TaxID=3373601 RepID=UPI0031C15D8D|nr:CPBP family intramembrane metalloprotease [Verrucomicrobiaceae bacterium E54]